MCVRREEMGIFVSWRYEKPLPLIYSRALCAVAMSKSIGHTKGVQSFSVREKQLETLHGAISVRMPEMQNKRYGISSAAAAAAVAEAAITKSQNYMQM